MSERPFPVRKTRPALIVLLVSLGLWTMLLFAGAGLAAFSAGSNKMPSDSMENTLRIGDTAFVDRTSDVRRGDIVVFKAPEWGGSGAPYLKRVIAVGGDRVQCCDARHRITVNGKPLDEDYTTPESTGQAFDVTVPPGRLWVMGDNRAVSADSRQHQGDPSRGTVAESNVEGRVFAVGGRPIGTPGTFTRNGLAESRSLFPLPVLGLLVMAAAVLLLLATGLATLVQLRRRRTAPR
jgi:signal peptidase I